MRAHDKALPGNEHKMRMWDKGSSVDLGRGFCVIRYWIFQEVWATDLAWVLRT